MYRGCDNCGHYIGRVCKQTGEELTMVCDQWTERGSDETESGEEREVQAVEA